MKLDIDCVRAVLLQCENITFNGFLTLNELVALLPEYAEDQICYTCIKLNEADYLNIVTKKYGSDILVARVTDITFLGHEFLNNIRTTKIMEHTKNISSKIGATSLQAFAQIASGIVTSLIKSELGLF